MESSSVRIQGERPLNGTITLPDAARCVVACPPHPNYGGSRRDTRVKAVSKALAEQSIACLRFDYGDWDDAEGEQDDIKRAIRWAADRHDSVGLFGYSFGASLALIVAATVTVDALAVLAPAATTEGFSVTDAMKELPRPLPLFIIVGTRDTTVDWEPVVVAAKDRDAGITELESDHFFIGKETAIGRKLTGFFSGHLTP